MSELDQTGHGVAVDPKDIEIYHLQATIAELTAALEQYADGSVYHPNVARIALKEKTDE